MKKILLILTAWAMLQPMGALGLTPSRAYQWGFTSGNLAANWSFENPLDFWMENPLSGFTLNARLKAAGTGATSAKSGSFVAQVTGGGSGNGYQSILSNSFPVQPSTAYTLSLYYKTTGTLTGQARPVIAWNSALQGGTSGVLTGSYYSSASSWTLAVMTFTTPSDAQYLSIVPAEFNSGVSGTYYFDDVVLEEGTLTSTQVTANRQNNSESMAFGDGLGRTLQTQSKSVAAGSTYLVGGTGFDDFARPETTFLATPYSISTPALQTSLLSGAQGFYNSTGPFDAKGYPFSRVKFADEPSPRVVESSSPDSAWQFTKGHTVKQDFYYVNDTLVPSNIESPSTNNAECRYRLDWSRDQDSGYSLAWSNRLGEVARRANNLSHTSSGANTWKWAATRYQYYVSGKVKKTLTPIDDSAGTSAFGEVSEYDVQGNRISSYSPDRNLKKYWYNRFGTLRYSQDQVQRPLNKYTYYEYDSQGRLTSEGVQVLTSLPQDSVDNDTYNQGTKTEQVGYIYDDTATFQSRTGFTLSDIMGTWKNYVNIHDSPNHLFCKYNRNLDDSLSTFSAKDKFVADFFSYDSRGNIVTTWKFIGPIRNTVKRLQDGWFAYDSQNRLISYMNYVSAVDDTLSNTESYAYDFLGRVSAISGIGGKPLASYFYADWGALNGLMLGGTATGDSSTNIDYSFHSQGGIRDITVWGMYGSTARTAFEQSLGYEGKAYPASGVPGLLQPKYSGAITQQLYKYTGDMNALKPVRVVNYAYDQLGRMGTAKAYLNTNATPLNSNEDIISGSLTMDTTSSLSSAFEYDLNGRILGQRSAGASSSDSARYSYATSSYRLDKVTGKTSAVSTRDMSASGTFVYDSSGALIQDKSKKLKVTYGWDGLPTSFSMDTAATLGALRCCTYGTHMMPLYYRVRLPTVVDYNFYDADGNRVSRVEVERKGNYLAASTNFVYMFPGMLKEWHETYVGAGKIATSSAVASLLGRGPQIGRIRADGKYEFYLKSANGSTMATVDDRAGYVNGRAEDYLAYGSYKDLKIGTSDPVTQKFTGKELEALTGLYAFGARWQDPELGMFMSPDPAEQFNNPYSFLNGDVINSLDPNGMYSWSKFWRQTGHVADDAGTFAGHETMEYGRAWRDDPFKTFIVTALVVGGTAITGGVLAEGISTISLTVGVEGATVAAYDYSVNGSGGGSGGGSDDPSSSGGGSVANLGPTDAEKELDHAIAQNDNSDGSESDPSNADSYTGTPSLMMPTTTNEGAGIFAPLSDIHVNSAFGAFRTVGTNPHVGVDLRAQLGTPVFAPADGTIYSVPNSRYNTENFIFPRGSHQGYTVQFLHLSERSVAAGRTAHVQGGEQIGLAGSTGSQGGPHLHVQVRDPDGNIINPAEIYGGIFE